MLRIFRKMQPTDKWIKEETLREPVIKWIELLGYEYFTARF